MLTSILPSTVAGQALLLAALSIAALTLVGVWYRRLAAQNRRLSNALDNMSQGLCMFDAQGCVVLTNRRYIGMYNLSPEIVRPGCSLQELMQHRKETGLFSGDVERIADRYLKTSTKRKAHNFTCNPATVASCSPRTSRCRAVVGSPPMRTSPNSAEPTKNAPPAKRSSSGARPSTRQSPRSGR